LQLGLRDDRDQPGEGGGIVSYVVNARVAPFCHSQMAPTARSSRSRARSPRLLRQEPPAALALRTPWTNSYLVATTGGAPLDLVKRYVENQKNA
jgi:REP element-mobilizing transposase RayT